MGVGIGPADPATAGPMFQASYIAIKTHGSESRGQELQRKPLN